MKKIYFLIVGLSLISTTKAQTALGIRGGTNLSNVSKSHASDNKTTYRFGSTAGIYTTIKLNNNLFIQPELLYSSEGYKRTITPSNDLRISYHVHSHYLNLPVLVKYKLNNGIVFELGPQASYLMGGHIKYQYNYINTEDVAVEYSEKEDIKGDTTRSFEFAGVIGVGYELKGGYSINARFTQGITNFIHSSNAGNFKNQFFSFTVGIPILKY